MNINYNSPNFFIENRQPLKDYTSNVDNIRMAKNRINELQNIINELNRSQNVKHSVSPLKKSPLRRLTPLPTYENTPQKSFENSKKPSPRFRVSEINENVSTPAILLGVIPDQLIEKDLDNYVLSKMLGLGSYASVRLATNAQNSVAIKTYEKLKLNDLQKRKNVQREVKILSKLRHPHIIKLIGACETVVQLHVIMEFFSSTSLNSFIKQKPNRKLIEIDAKLIFRQIIDAVRYCHHKNVVHRDIKLENILIDDREQIKLIDFGFSIAIDPSSKLNIFCGTPSYMAPEIVNKQQYSFPADVWALGILLYKISTGLFPFRGNDDKDLYRKINQAKFEFPQYMSTSLRNLISKMLQHDQYIRPSLKDLMNDEWLLI